MSLDAIGLFLEATTLKRIPRMGWAMRGVPHVESVAEHSHAMTIVALALADLLNASGTLAIPLNLEKVLTIATLHDLAEARLTDLPASAQRLIPDEIKSQRGGNGDPRSAGAFAQRRAICKVVARVRGWIDARGPSGARRRQARNDGPVPEV